MNERRSFLKWMAAAAIAPVALTRLRSSPPRGALTKGEIDRILARWDEKVPGLNDPHGWEKRVIVAVNRELGSTVQLDATGAYTLHCHEARVFGLHVSRRRVAEFILENHPEDHPEFRGRIS